MKKERIIEENEFEVLSMELQKLADYIAEHCNNDFTRFYDQLPATYKKDIVDFLVINDYVKLTDPINPKNLDFPINYAHIYFNQCPLVLKLLKSTIISINKDKPGGYPKRYVQVNLAVQKYYEN